MLYCYTALIYRIKNQCCGSVGSVHFWASWIRIQIRWSGVQIRILLSSRDNSKVNDVNSRIRIHLSEAWTVPDPDPYPKCHESVVLLKYGTVLIDALTWTRRTLSINVLSMIAPKVGTASLYSRHSSTILSTSSAWICIKGQCQEMHDCFEGLWRVKSASSLCAVRLKMLSFFNRLKCMNHLRTHGRKQLLKFYETISNKRLSHEMNIINPKEFQPQS